MAENVKNEGNLLKRIYFIDSEINSNNNLIFQSRQMIEENRSMILNNYASAFSGITNLLVQTQKKYIEIEIQFF